MRFLADLARVFGELQWMQQRRAPESSKSPLQRELQRRGLAPLDP
jgi:hypothetical protein